MFFPKFICAAAALMLMVPGNLRASENSPGADSDTKIAWAQNVDMDMRATLLLTRSGVADSVHNPDNRLAGLSDLDSKLTLKPDFYIAGEDLSLSIQPRASFQYAKNEIAGHETTLKDADFEVSRFKLQKIVSPNLFVSYGWENIQWGPSFLYSPSNVFYNDNGKKDLVSDLDGKGVARLLYVHDYHWSASFLVNTDKGAFNESDFERIYAVKLDYEGDDGYASAILSYREHDKTRLGGFAGLTVGDALLVYAEAQVEKSNPALKPFRRDDVMAWEMAAVDEDDQDFYPVLLGGFSYTLASADTITVEYLYDGRGYTDSEAQAFNALANDASAFIKSSSLLSGYGKQLLGEAATNHLDFLRHNYLMLQYVNEDVIEGLDLVNRVIYCPDDGASQWYASLSYDLTEHLELKASGLLNAGGTNASFGRFLENRIQIALEMVF